MPLFRAYSRNLGQRSILVRRGTYLNRAYSKNLEQHSIFYPLPPPSPPSFFSIPFLSVLDRNKVLQNFRKREQRLIVERNKGLDYALLVASNSHILTILSHPLWKNVNESKKLCTGSANYHVFQSFEVFFSDKISFFLITCVWRQDLKLKKRSLLFSKEKWWLAAGICLIWKLMEYKNDNSPDVSIITTF